MDPLIAWLIKEYGLVGVALVVGGWAYLDQRKTNRENEKRYIDLVEKNAAVNQAHLKNYTDLVISNIKALSDLEQSDIRLRDMVDERTKDRRR